MYNDNSSPTVTNCTFSGNSAGGGGGMCNGYYSSPTVTNCNFIGNGAEGGGGMFNSYNSSPIVTGCTFSSNSADFGGGVYNDGSSPILTNCTFSNNTADGGGGMYNDHSYPVVTNCTFTGNSAKCTFSGNVGQQGGGMFWGFYTPVINCCIFWDNGSDGICGRVSTDRVTYCNIEGGWPGEGNIDADPCFVDSGYWDPNGTPEDANDDFFVTGDYHLKSQAGRYNPITQTWVYDAVTSPCIDAGDISDPIGYEPFPNGGIINMGAYGGTTEASKSYFGLPLCETIVAGDINGDCKVNFLDFRLMALHWCEDNRE
jgi:hypothetical protein